MTNLELWDKIRGAFPSFAGHTSKGTAELFTAAGYEKLKKYDADALSDFFSLSMRVWLDTVTTSHAVDTLESQGFGEYKAMPWGGYVQRLATYSVKPISPAYKDLKNGAGPDPFVVRKPESSERFWKQNFDYASLITMPDDFQYKQIFVADNGMSEYMAGLMEGLQNGYTIQMYENKLEALNAGLNSTDTPLLATQKMTVTLSSDPTDEELRNFILAVNNVVEAMTLGPQVSGFNAMSYGSTQDKSRLKLLVRPGLKNTIKVRTMAGAFNPSNLALDVDTVVVPHFGGLVPYKDAKYATRLYPVYDTLGAVVGFAETEGATAATVQESAVYWKDPNAGIVAVLADRGIITSFQQNGYTVESIRNPRGRYTDFWASAPNNAIVYDPIFNVVTFSKA